MALNLDPWNCTQAVWSGSMRARGGALCTWAPTLLPPHPVDKHLPMPLCLGHSVPCPPCLYPHGVWHPLWDIRHPRPLCPVLEASTSAPGLSCWTQLPLRWHGAWPPLLGSGWWWGSCEGCPGDCQPHCCMPKHSIALPNLRDTRRGRQPRSPSPHQLAAARPRVWSRDGWVAQGSCPQEMAELHLPCLVQAQLSLMPGRVSPLSHSSISPT